MSSAIPKILIVEDDAIESLVLQRIVRQLGFTVAGSVLRGEEVAAAVREKRPSLVLMDIRLAGEMDGIEAASRIQMVRPTPIVFLTAYADQETLRRAIAVEPHAYLVKPFNETELRTTIELALYRFDAEQERKKKQEAQSKALWELEDGLIIADSKGLVQYANSKAEQITGWKVNEILWQPLAEVYRPIPLAQIPVDEIPPDIRPYLQATGAQALVGRTGRRVWIVQRREQTSSENGEPLEILHIRDAAERLEVETGLHRAYFLGTLSRLMGGIARSFSNQLSIIRSYSELLSEDPEQQKQEAVGAVKSAADRASSLVDSLLAISGESSLQMQAVDLNTLLNHWAISEQARFPNYVIEVNVDAQLPPVDADPKLLLDAVEMIAENAREAMPNGGVLRLDTGLRSPAQPGSTRREIAIDIQDSGPGIQMEDRSRIFDPFFTTRQHRNAAGLGLAAVRGILAQFGGSATLLPSEERGARFRLTLKPREQQNETAQRDNSGRSKTVWLVEESGPLRLLVSDCLPDYRVQVIPSFSEAVSRLPGSDPAPDLMIIDVDRVPIEAVEALVPQARNFVPRLRVVALDGSGSRRQAVEGVAIVKKPFNASDLRTAVNG